MTGIGMSEKQAWLNLTSGEHTENIAIYELLRRRCKFIVCVSGESDPDFTIDSIAISVGNAQSDFGIRVGSKFNKLRTLPIAKNAEVHLGFSHIYYPDRATGFLLYVGLSMKGHNSQKMAMAEFFDAEQIEACRQMGIRVGDHLLSQQLIADSRPASIPEWFRQLALNSLNSRF